MKSPKSMRSAAGSAQAPTGEAQANQPDGGQGAESLLKADHRAVEALFEKYKAAGSAAQKADLAKQVCTQLIVHATLEEEIFYPACREKNVENDMMNEAQVEHDGAKILIAELVAQSPDDEFYDAKVTVLSEYIKHHVGEEEKPSDGIFAKARQAGVDMSALGQRLQTRRQELMAKAEADGLPPSMPRSLHFQIKQQPQNRQEYENVDRRSQSHDRDDRGRFVSDDDDRGYSRGSRGRFQARDRDEQGRFMSDDDDRGYSRGGAGRSQARDRDEQGRFMSDDEDRGSSRSGGGRGYRSNEDRDYDDNGRSGRGRGWSGDPEGHSEAARRGWDERGSGRQTDDDDRRGSSMRGRAQGGWSGDPEGHSEASHRGREERGSRGGRRRDDDYDDRRGASRSGSRYEDDDNDRRGMSSRGRDHGGWFGDPEGHAQAAERGWEERRSSGSGRRSDDDDGRESRDRRRSGGRGGDDEGHGGWFGDSRGHAEAARRGWRNRE